MGVQRTLSPSAVYYSEPPTATAIAVDTAPLDADDEVTILVGRWEFGLLCGCCSPCMPTCPYVIWLPFVVLAQIAGRLEVMKASTAFISYFVVATCLGIISIVLVDVHYGCLSDCDSITGVNYYAMPMLGIFVYTSLFVWYLRAATRARYKIPGNCLCDFLASALCSCCAMAQMASHLKSNDFKWESSKRDDGRDSLPSYTLEDATNWLCPCGRSDD